MRGNETKKELELRTSDTDSDVRIGGLLAVEVVLVKELGQLGLDTAQRLVMAVEQHDQV